MLCGVLSLPVPLEPILSYTCPAALRETKHTCPDSSGTTQDFFIFFIDLKQGTLPTTRQKLTQDDILFLIVILTD